MSESDKKLTREDVAKMEIGRTDISRSGAVTLVAAFLVTVALVLPVQTLVELRSPESDGAPQYLDIFRQLGRAPGEFQAAEGSFQSRFFAVNRTLLKTINEYEDALEDSSFLEKALLPPMQLAFSKTVGLGNEQAYLGKDQWLYYRPGVDSVMGAPFLDERQLLRRSRSGNEWQPAPEPDPIAAITQFRDQLAQREIQLVLVPCPIKATLQPENLSSHYRDRETPLHNASYGEFLSAVEQLGVPVFDPTAVLSRMDGDTFLKTDTHWTPQAMDRCATELASFLERLDPTLRGDRLYRERSAVVSAVGDVAQMLRLPDTQDLYRPETATIAAVTEPDGSPWQRSESAAVLLLGDSFSNIYSLEQMGWGAKAGLAERLSFHLRSPIDALVRNDAGAFATRAELGKQMARGRDRLTGKKVVIWQFAARELAVGDWKLLAMGPPEENPPRVASGFLSLNVSKSVKVKGVIVEASAVPVPRSVPYKDHIRTLHLRDLRPVSANQELGGDEALVYIWSMRDNEWTAAARLQTGDPVELSLTSWGSVSEELESINQSDVEDIDLQLEEHCWGELK